MKSKIFLALAALMLSLPAAAEMRTHIEAWELPASYVRLPVTDAGTVAFKLCHSCAYETRQTARNMVWKLNGRGTTLENFRKAMARINDLNKHLIVVAKRVTDNKVTEVVIWVQ